MALCPGQPRWAGTRRDIHPLTPETCCGIILDFMRRGEDNRGKCTNNPAGRHRCPHFHHPPNFYPDAFLPTYTPKQNMLYKALTHKHVIYARAEF